MEHKAGILTVLRSGTGSVPITAPAGIIGSAAINVIGSASGDITGSSSLAKPIGQTSVCYPSGSPAGRAGGTLGARRQAR